MANLSDLAFTLRLTVAGTLKKRYHEKNPSKIKSSEMFEALALLTYDTYSSLFYFIKSSKDLAAVEAEQSELSWLRRILKVCLVALE